MEQISSLLCAVSLCALLLCGVVLLFPMMGAKLAPSPAEEAAFLKQPLVRCTAPDLDQISWKSGEKRFLLVNQGSRFLLNNTETVPLRQEMVAQLLHLFENFPIGESTALPQTPADLEITLLFTSGRKQTLLLWQMDNKICLSSGSSAQLFPLDQLQALLQEPAAYADRRLCGDLPLSATIEIKGSAYSSPLLLSYYIEGNNPYGGLTAPITAPIPQEQLAPILQSLHGLQGDHALSLIPDTEELGESFCTLTLRSETESTVLHASRPQADGTVFLWKEGLPVLYQIHQSKLPWLSLSTETLTEQELFHADYEDCIAFTLQTPEERIRFTKWDGLVLCGDRPVEEAGFRSFFRETMTLIPSAVALHPPVEEEALLTMTLSYTNPEKPRDSICFLPYAEEQLLLSINGESRFLLPKESFHRILTRCQQLIER